MSGITLDWNAYLETARRVVAEGCVLLKNDDDALPLVRNSVVSFFGRIQNYYYKSGTGSGGMVNVSKVTNIVDGLRESGHVSINEKLAGVYAEWEKENPADRGVGWGNEPWSQPEMPVSDELAEISASESDAAVVIIGRTAGEDRDNINAKGAYLLSETEEEMLATVCRHFEKVIVLLNVGGIIDMNFVEKYNPSAVMYVWQGGMTGGSGVADVLSGKVTPSGKLSDTIAYSIADYPSHSSFGDDIQNCYCEDIYVGYRYFETFAKNKVQYPFGFGLSYTTFDVQTINADISKEKISLAVSVKNTGSYNGREVVQIYFESPQGKLGKPVRNLLAFRKTDVLATHDEQIIVFDIDYSQLASYDDIGITGHKSCYVLEAGTYNIYAGTDVRSAQKAASFDITSLIVTEQLTEALAPVTKFKRIKPVPTTDGYAVAEEDVPLSTLNAENRRAENIPAEVPFTDDRGIRLRDVLEDRNTMESFVAQLSDIDLSCIVRGEGMGSPRVTPGTASAFGGVSDKLVSMGIPVICCDDGPSGMRLDCGTKAFSLPNGTLFACTFDPELTEELFAMLGAEMAANKVECLLGPGMNIHRHPLNGRNFEYFSEDPYLTGMMASGELRGLHKAGVTGTLKHFCANNQEKRRHFTDSAVSERALREIYLKGFEIAVKSGNADSIMTTYGAVNGVWTAGNYDLNTTILRGEWGFSGIVMTDWWASINEPGKPADRTNFAAMIRAQNDLYMVCPEGSKNLHNDNTLEALSDGRLSRAELQRSAINICRFAMHSMAMGRLIGTAPEIKIINRPAEDCDCDISDVEFITVNKTVTVNLEGKESAGGTNLIFGFDVATVGKYKFSLTASSELGELAQIPCTVFCTGIPMASLTFNGTGGQDVTIERDILMIMRYSVVRLYVGASGLKLKSFTIRLKDRDEDFPGNENCNAMVMQ